MKRVLKKTIATVLSSAMLFSTVLQGDITPLFAGVLETDTADISFDVLADTEYDDGGVDDEGFFFMKGGKFGEEVDENAVLVVMDENGKKTEIPSKTSNGRKFTKAVKAVSGAFYNMVELFNGTQWTLLRTNGTYFGGTEQYYDYVEPVSDTVILVGADTGETEEKNGSEYKVYDYQLVTDTGKQIALGKGNLSLSASATVGKRTIINCEDRWATHWEPDVNPVSVIYDAASDELIKADGTAMATGGDYYSVVKDNAATVYDKDGRQVMVLPQGYIFADTAHLDSDGYAYISTEDYWYSNHKNIISRDGILWDTADRTAAEAVDMSVINAQKGLYYVTIRTKVQTGTTSTGTPTYKDIYENKLLSRDGSVNMDIEEEIQRLGGQKGYKSVTGLFYAFNENFVINVKDLEDNNSGAVFAYSDSAQYTTPAELEGNLVNSKMINTAEGYLLTQQRTYTEGSQMSVMLAGLYNRQFEQVAFAGDADVACGDSVYSFGYANEQYIFEITGTDGKYHLMDKSGKLTGEYDDFEQIYGDAGDWSNIVRCTNEAYIIGINGSYKEGYTVDIYNAAGVKILSDITDYEYGYNDLDGDGDYLVVERKNGYILCDHNGNIIMTEEQYGLYDFFETDDGSLLACVYKTDDAGNKKFGAVKILSTDIDKNKNGVFVEEDGSIHYYVKGRIQSDYTGMAADADGKKYWFDNGVAARGKEACDPKTGLWYWFDADGTMATGKDVNIPDGTEGGKWVRYDENGGMVKGEQCQDGKWYHFDEITGEMTHGEYIAADGTPYYYDEITGIGLDCKWHETAGNQYWYQAGKRQGLEGRGKEIYDPASDAWYWLDSIDNGKKAVSKDVYQDSWAGQYADREDGTGKWVRYNADGHMVKGWNEQNGNTYYFDLITGAMAKGTTVIDGTTYTFDWRTGALQ